MGRRAIWTSVDQIVQGFKEGVLTKQRIQTDYFNALGRGYIDRSNLFKEALEEIEKL